MRNEYTSEDLYNNKLICEFLGAKCEVAWENLNSGEKDYSVKSPIVVEWRNKLNNTGGYEESMMLQNTRFHNDWNWIMMVVEHIQKMNGGCNFFFKMECWHTCIYYFDPYRGYDEDDIIVQTTALEVKSILESVYQTVLKFIIWHNSK